MIGCYRPIVHLPTSVYFNILIWLFQKIEELHAEDGETISYFKASVHLYSADDIIDVISLRRAIIPSL